MYNHTRKIIIKDKISPMLENPDFKLIVAVIASIITITAYLPYLKDIFKKKTQPHLYTWLIWAITQGTATAILLYGGGKFGSLSFIVGTLLVLVIFGLSFKYGTKNIKKVDIATLTLAILAIVVWWQLDNPLLSIIMVSSIDVSGYIPTFRKSYKEPWSETLAFWFIMAVVKLLIMVSNAEYNFLTMTYVTISLIANSSLFILLVVRRRLIKKPEIFSQDLYKTT